MIARVTLLLVLASAALSGQAVRGRVLQADSAGPAAGVLIAVTDARGTVPPVSVATGDTALVRIVLARDLVRLSALTVSRSDDCRARDQGGARVADVWEEAR